MQTDHRPAPYPATTSAKGWRFELDYERITRSDTWSLATPSMKPWLLMLWMTSWQQVPCGSLPNDDELIIARIGIDPEVFAANRRVLLRGWWIADDGRMYHETVTERVLEMVAFKARDRERKRGAAPTPPVGQDPAALSTGIHVESTWTPPGLQSDSSTGTRTSTGTSTGTPGKKTPPTPRKRGVADGAPKTPAASKAVPEDFQVTADMVQWASENTPLVDLETQTKMFRLCDFTRPHSDWAKTWKRWMLKAQLDEANNTRSPRAGPIALNRQQAVEDRNRSVVEQMIAKQQGGAQ